MDTDHKRGLVRHIPPDLDVAPPAGDTIRRYAEDPAVRAIEKQGAVEMAMQLVIGAKAKLGEDITGSLDKHRMTLIDQRWDDTLVRLEAARSFPPELQERYIRTVLKALEEFTQQLGAIQATTALALQDITRRQPNPPPPPEKRRGLFG